MLSRRHMKFSPRAGGQRATAHGHFSLGLPPSSFHSTSPQALRSFFYLNITEISTFYTSIWISCSKHQPILSGRVIRRKIVVLVHCCSLCCSRTDHQARVLRSYTGLFM